MPRKPHRPLADVLPTDEALAQMRKAGKAEREKVRLAIENAVNEALDASPYFRDKDQVDYGAAQVTVPPVKRGRRPNNA